MDKRIAESLRKKVANKKAVKVKAMYYIDEDLHAALKKLSSEDGTSASDTVEELIREYLTALGKI